MGKGSTWKRIIAREWLYLLGFALGSGILTVLVLLIFYPKNEPAWLDLPPSSVEATMYDAYLVVRFAQLADSLGASAASATLADTRVSSLTLAAARDWVGSGNFDPRDDMDAFKKQFPPFRRNVYERWEAERAKWSNRASTVDDIAAAVLFLPYLLFLFLRTILWSIRQVKSKSE